MSSLWLAAGAALLLTLGAVPVERTQEARVLVTAREMVDAPPERWLIPRCNGEIRLRKPPLAYWLTATSFNALGVSEVAGRLPATICAWLLLGVTYRAGVRLCGRRGALLAAAALFGCVGFLHYSNLAETDIVTALFVTVATVTTWRGYLLMRSSADRLTGVRSARWYRAGAAAMGLTVLTKGPPGAYPLLFLTVMTLCDADWRPFRGWLRSGAPFILFAIAAPWFLYISSHLLASELSDDLARSAAGGSGHRDWFIEYVPHLLALLAPWSGMAVLSLAWAVRRRADERVRALLVWLLSILVPLSLWGNKQPHYLLPALPPIMLLTGWVCDLALRPRARGPLVAWARGVFIVSAATFATMMIGVLVMATLRRGAIGRIDLLVSATIASGAAAAAATYWCGSGRRAIVAAVAGISVAMPLLSRCWEPTLSPVTLRTVTRLIRQRHGNAPYAFYGEAQSLPLCFYFRTVIPRLPNADAVARAAAARPGLVLIEATSVRALPAPVPDGYVPKQQLIVGDRKFVIFAPASPSRT